MWHYEGKGHVKTYDKYIQSITFLNKITFNRNYLERRTSSYEREVENYD